MGDFRTATRGRISQTLRKKFPNIERLKQRIIRQHGLKPTFTFYYYAVDPIKYIDAFPSTGCSGEEWVRKSLESICSQGDVVVGNYNSTDGIVEIAKEYGAKVIDVEPAEDFFPEAKIANKIFYESTSNFMVYLNFNIAYPPNFARFFKDWVRRSDISRRALRVFGQAYYPDGTLAKKMGSSVSFMSYRPFIMHCRGFDERALYNRGGAEYATFLLNYLWRLPWDTKWIDMRHRAYTYNERRVYLNETYNYYGKNVEKVYKLMENLFKNIDPQFKNVKNSYW